MSHNFHLFIFPSSMLFFSKKKEKFHFYFEVFSFISIDHNEVFILIFTQKSHKKTNKNRVNKQNDFNNAISDLFLFMKTYSVILFINPVGQN